MALYQEYEAKILIENCIDISSDGIKRDIELYDPEQMLKLPSESLERIQKYLDDYNYLTRNTFKLRYYQVLALLFTDQFLENQTVSTGFDLNGGQEKQRMLAYWMATGSGKTLVMHLNILQYLHHFCKSDGVILQIFLTTPLANLIKQHERELEPYVRQLNETYNNRIELIIDTTQGLLQKEQDYFQMSDDRDVRRLILVDEAHIGLTGQAGKFRELRKNRLNVGNSFLFEYSATFHNIAKELKEEYNNAIIYRYDYTRFYGDGYGKDHFFKPIEADKVGADESEEEIKDNLDECLRVMEEKLHTFDRVRKDKELEDDFTVHRPLMAFMGHTVENPSKEGDGDEVSDIQKILDYFAALRPEERENYRSIFGGDIIGRLVVARNPENNSELLLSYGDGKKWGMINVGDAIGFFNSINNNRIDTFTEVIVDPDLQFENLDNDSSPINVLIGSRKFAEGWNSYRLSVIDLINLGTSKGNLIIQIFGRGVRLHGIGGCGKRRHIEHNRNYYNLRKEDKNDDIRRLETLTVFSLKRSYLEHFLKEVHAGGVPLLHTFPIKVNPTFFKVDGNTSVRFEQYSKKLSIFKQRTTAGSGFKRVFLNEDNIHYKYQDGEDEKSGTINKWRPLKCDYRTDKERDSPNVYWDLEQNIEKYSCYLNRAKLATVIHRVEETNQLQLYNKTNCKPTISDILSLVDEIRYHEPGSDPIAWTDGLNRQIVIDVIRKLRNRINAHINRRNYLLAPLNRDDFIYEYTVTKEFKDSSEYEAFLAKIKESENEQDKTKALRINPEAPIQRELTRGLTIHRHIYNPLIRQQDDVESDYNDVKVSPDRLNAGEKKFVEDLTEYIKLNYLRNERYEFYLMRNVQKIGIFLESDAGSFFPDFILWTIDNESDITHIIFIDPKGERGIIGGSKANYRDHPKVKLAKKSEDQTLLLLEKQLETKQDKKFQLDSFLLLRDSSELGRQEDFDWITENMLAYNILRLDWHQKKENGSTSKCLNDEKSYLDLMFEKVGIQPKKPR